MKSKVLFNKQVAEDLTKYLISSDIPEPYLSQALRAIELALKNEKLKKLTPKQIAFVGAIASSANGQVPCFEDQDESVNVYIEKYKHYLKGNKRNYLYNEY